MYSNIYNILMYSSIVPSQFLISVLLQKENFFFLKTWKSSIMLLNLNFLFFIFKFLIHLEFIFAYGLPWWLSGEESACQWGDASWIPEMGRSLGEGNDNPFQHCCLGKPMDRGVWWATVHGVSKESDTTLSD